jgi:SHS2 domain-containing protein
MKEYELLPHTADVGVRVFGRSKKELFENAAKAMFEMIADISKVEKKKAVGVHVKEKNFEELLVAWLREILYFYQTQKLLFSDFGVAEFNEDRISLKGYAHGEPFDEARHAIKKDIKAVTYHDLKIQKHPEKSLLFVDIVFDT